jgi:acyl-CoA synthetase (AMP-forming)/AMP-acid ligase II
VSLSILLDMMADAWPDRVAFGSRDTGVTYSQLRSAAARGAVALQETGHRSVGYMGVNGIEFALAMWSAALAGMWFCPFNYRLSTQQLNPLFGILPDPLVLVGDGYEALVAGCSAPTASLTGFTSAARDETVASPVVTAADDSGAGVVLFTSGTTSTPKAVALSQANLLSYVIETVDFGSAEPSDAVIVSMPPYHIAGVNASLTNPYAGRRVVYLPNFDAESWLGVVRTESITHAMVVPTMLARILDTLDRTAADVPSLRMLSYGGSRMPRAVLERALATFPTVDFVNAYGLTETSSTVTVLGPEDHRAAMASDDPHTRNRLGSVGRPVPGISAEARDPDGMAQPPGVVGELWVRGRQISGSYLGQGSVLDESGWFPTRDRASIDTDGYVYLEGRADDTIIRAGENIAPAEIEEVLANHEAIADVAVIGRLDDEWGERIVAAIVLRPGAMIDAEGVRDHVRGQLRSSRTPDDVVFVKELPYTPTGKLVRRELADLVERAGGAMSEPQRTDRGRGRG